MKRLISYIFLFLSIVLSSCSNEAPMEREKFTRLMVEVHLTDALLAEGKRNSMGLTDRKNYSFYGELLGRYGLTRGQFDSCVDYYSRNTTLIEQIYKDVIDSLNKRLTVVKRELAKLRVNDTVNILPISDTVWVEGWAEDTVVTLANLRGGKYFFEFGFKSDSIIRSKRPQVVTYFLRNYNKDTVYYADSAWIKTHFMRMDSVVNEMGEAIRVDSLFNYEQRQDSFVVCENRVRIDTFKMRPINLAKDTAFHDYSWSYFVDSTFETFQMRFIVDDTVVPQYGYATKVGLYNQYLSESAKREQERDFERRSRNSVALGDSIITTKRISALIHDTLQ